MRAYSRHCALAASLGMILAISFGCSSERRRARNGPPLPFLVQLDVSVVDLAKAATNEDATEVELPANRTELESSDEPATQPGEEAEDLGVILSQLVVDSETFAAVSRHREAAAPNLELSVEIQGSDFGPHSPITSVATWSTIAWLFAGHLSWFIDDVEFTQSDYYLQVRARVPGRSKEIELSYRPVKGLELDLKDRLRGAQWIWAILAPPYLVPGDSRAIRKSLLERSLERFILEELSQVAELLPSQFLATYGCYVVHDEASDRLIILSREPLRELVIANTRVDSLSLENDHLVDDPIAIFNRLADLDIARLPRHRDQRVYSISLPNQLTGLTKVETYLESEAEPHRWTIGR